MLQIRKAEQKDMETLVDFNNRLALETENRPLDLPRLRASMQAILDDERKGVYLLACDGEEVHLAQRQFYVADGFVCAAAAPQTRCI